MVGIDYLGSLDYENLGANNLFSKKKTAKKNYPLHKGKAKGMLKYEARRRFLDSQMAFTQNAKNFISSIHSAEVL